MLDQIMTTEQKDITITITIKPSDIASMQPRLAALYLSIVEQQVKTGKMDCNASVLLALMARAKHRAKKAAKAPKSA